MVVSILSRFTAITNAEQGQTRLKGVMPKIETVLKQQPGFVSVQYLWGADGDGSIAHITMWQTLEDCRNYVRGGGAASVATIEEAVLPAAAYPRGRAVRSTYHLVGE